MRFELFKDWLGALVDLFYPTEESPFRLAVASALGLGVLLSVFLSWNAFQIRGGTVETAQVMRVSESSYEHRCGFGVFGKQATFDVRWESQNPPDGMTASFVEEGSCTDRSAGETADIVRQYDGGDLELKEVIVDSLEDAVLMVLTVVFGTFVISFVLASIAFRMPRWVEQVRRRLRRDSG